MGTCAKVQRPLMETVHKRERLFRKLDQATKRPVVWIAAGAGCGKTTLALSYLEDRKLKSAWYHVDSGDEDVASFFYHLGLACSSAGAEGGESLPVFKPEYLKELPAFSRNFFRQLYGGLELPSAIVLDNYEAVGESSSIHEIVRIGMEEAPRGITLIVNSRLDPHAAFARMRLSDRMVLITWPDLRLTFEESAVITRLRLPDVDENTMASLFRRTGGWVAGLILALEQMKRSGEKRTSAGFAQPSLVFDYIAGEIFQQIDEEQKRFMMITSFLPRMTASTAEALSGSPTAESILNDLTRSG